MKDISELLKLLDIDSKRELVDVQGDRKLLESPLEKDTIDKLFEIGTTYKDNAQTNIFNYLNQSSRLEQNESVFLLHFQTNTNVNDLNESSLFFYFDSISHLITRIASRDAFSIEKVQCLLDRLYSNTSGSQQIQMAAIRAIMTIMTNEVLALYFFRKENVNLVERLVKEPASKSLLVALLSCCFSKFSDQTSDQVKAVLKKVVSNFMDSDMVKGLVMLNAIALANPAYASVVFMNDGFLESLVDTLDVEEEIIQYHTVELFSSICALPECRKAIGMHSGLLIPFYRQTKSLRLQLVALLTLVKLIPINAEASKELLSNQEIVAQIADILQSENKEFEAAALEGLVYLSVYPFIKEKIVNNTGILESLKSFLSNGDRSSVYATAQIFSNVTAYPALLTEEEQQARKLHQMAKSLPENDPLDEEDAVTARIDKVVQCDLIPALTKVKSDSINILAAISQIICSVAINQKHRGRMIQCGVIPLLLKYSNILMHQDILVAAHALAKILITTNPALACKGELANEVIRPLVFLLVKGKHGLQQFESLMALTNLAGMNDDVRTRILSLDTLIAIENLQFSTNTMIKRASTELLCNLVYHPIVFSRYLDPKSGPGLQVMTALSDDDDFPTRRAASGALAVLSSEPEGIPLLAQQKRFFEIVLGLLQDKELELVHRGAELIKNVFADAKVGKSVPQNVLDAMKKLVKVPHPAIAECAKEGLLKAMKLGIRIS